MNFSTPANMSLLQAQTCHSTPCSADANVEQKVRDIMCKVYALNGIRIWYKKATAVLCCRSQSRHQKQDNQSIKRHILQVMQVKGCCKLASTNPKGDPVTVKAALVEGGVVLV